MHSHVQSGVQVNLKASHQKFATLHMLESCTGGPAAVVKTPLTAEEAAVLSNKTGHCCSQH